MLSTWAGHSLSLGGGGVSYPAIVTARSLQSVWTRNTNSGYTETITKNATANSGTRDALPTGASYGLSGSQHYVIITANGGTPVNFNNWRFTIPVVIFNAGGQCNFNQCYFTGSDIVTQGMKNWFCGLNPISTTYSDGARVKFSYCTIDLLGASSFTAPLSSGLVQNSAAGATMSVAEMEYCKVDYVQGSHVQVYGNFTAYRTYFGAHCWTGPGGWVDPDLGDDPPHSESLWGAYGSMDVQQCLFDPSASNPYRPVNSWTSHMYIVGRFGPLNSVLKDNIFIGNPTDAPYAITMGKATPIQEPGQLGALGTVEHSNNIIQPCVNGYYIADAYTQSTFDIFYDQFDFVTGNRITTPEEVIPGNPVITTASTASINENAQLSIALAANERIVSWVIRTSAQDATSVDHDKFEISGTILRWASNGVKDYEAPDDTGTNNTYSVVVRATDNTGLTTDKLITVTVLDVAEFNKVQFEANDIFRVASSSNLGMTTSTRLGLLVFTLQLPSTPPASSQTVFGNVGGTTFSIQILTGSGKIRLNLFDNGGGTFRVESTGDECTLSGGNFRTYAVYADISQTTAAAGSKMWRHDGSNWSDITFSGANWPYVLGRTLNWGTAAQWQIGSTTFNRQFEKFYLRPASTLDLSTSANLAAAVNASLMQSNGSGMDGTQPNIYLHGNAATWNAGHNNGSGGVNFNAVGGITVTDV